MNIDLHSHSTASDGCLDPADLCLRAAGLGVDVLAITDHDTTAAYRNLAPPGPLTLIHGIEFSTQFRDCGIHVLGLNVDVGNDSLIEGIGAQQAMRTTRAERIAEKLEKKGIRNILPEIRAKTGHSNTGRLHFAQHLVDAGHVTNIKQAFKIFLGKGRPCFFKQNWAPMQEIIELITGAGGIAVLAHPAKYKLTKTRLRELLDAFGKAGGQGMEVVSGQQNPEVTRMLTRMSVEKGLLASCGSDFHQPDQPWSELGRFPELPAECRPVWEEWNLVKN
jgi:predicted metal-dependent phosphoesterase TrpH